MFVWFNAVTEFKNPFEIQGNPFTHHIDPKEIDANDNDDT
jgi:hypothetical protein